MLIAYYRGPLGWRLSIEIGYRWIDLYYPCNASEWIVPGTIDCNIS